ncbi:MAG: PD-(D/E)XK nuclease family protein [Candidatus Staskawiczbacteria bacterium]|nr:PD-(D/E)XK nuclease family protein [Candidatus Staskawiczbacteria bacterium]
MPPDKYKAVWVSHSSIGDFLKCPRAYFLHNVYKNPKGHKINVVNQHLSLGIAVHETLEGLLKYKTEDRFKKSLLETFEENWAKVSGKVGGFKNAEEEREAKARAKRMIERVNENPGPLAKLAVKLRESANNMPPNFYLSEDDNIILSGKIDWLEWVPEDDSVRVIDFKTGKNDEDKDSLQLPIYALLLNALQKRKVSGAAYWYVDRNNEPTEVLLPDIVTAKNKVLAVAIKVKNAREKGVFECPNGPTGCFACKPFEKILRGEALLVKTDEERKTELYMI